MSVKYRKDSSEPWREIEILRGPKGDPGETGAAGKDGLVTSIKINGVTYIHDNGVITLPDYPTVSGDIGTMTEIPSEVITESELTKALESYATSTTVNDLTDRVVALETNFANTLSAYSKAMEYTSYILGKDYTSEEE